MITKPRLLSATCAALAVALATGTASAQSPDTPTDPANPEPGQPTPGDTTPPSDPAATPPPIQQETPPAPPPAQSTREDYEEEPSWRSGRFRDLGIAVSAGGGVTDFTDDTLRDTTGPAGAWAVRVAVGTRAPLTLEASYFGSAQEIDALGLDDDAVLVGNGIQGALRVNVAPTLPLSPFVFAGLAWTHFDVTNTNTNTSAISDSDDLLEIPLGVGFGTTVSGLALDVRGEFRYATRENMVPDLGGILGEGDDYSPMHRWGVAATLGINL